MFSTNRSVGRFSAFLCALLGGAFLSHIAWSAAVSLYMHNENGLRMPEAYHLRHEAAGRDLAAAYMHENDGDVLVVGSSFSYGYDMKGMDAYPVHLAALLLQHRVTNLALSAASYDVFQDWVYCSAVRSGKSYKIVILEIPVINQNDSIARLLKDNAEPPKVADGVCGNAKTDKNYFNYFFRYPYGVSWVPLVRDVFKNSTESTKVAIGNFPENYVSNPKIYELIRPIAMDQRADLLRSFSSIADMVIVFQTPIYIDGLVQAGFERKNVMRQFMDGITFCKSSENVVCIDTSSLIARDDLFRDVVHFNKRGHAFFAEWLYKKTKAAIEKRFTGRDII